MFEKYVKESIKELISEISKDPFLHFSEKSLQARLAAKLLNCSELSKPIPTLLYEKYALSIPPLQMEYGVKEIPHARIDIAILDQNKIKSIDSCQFKKGGKFLDPIIGIEIGTEKNGWKKMPEHLKKDAEKLKNCDIGYILTVMRNCNVKSSQKKDNQIELFKKDMQKIATSKDTNINWIGLIIYIKDQKVDFFDKNNKWETFQNPSDEFTKAVINKL